MEVGDTIEFLGPRTFSYIRKLGSGGTGLTVLVKDELLNELFAIKKYQPSEANKKDREENYHRFVDEIKMLFKISHPNIVRPYNYYLYPDSMLGYIQMEFVDGVSIDEYANENPKKIDELFISAISAFLLLESKGILHRDIRPANILIDNNNTLKLIDFGFGKIRTEENSLNSVFLNWPVTNQPNEIIYNKEYNHQTEIYFLGKLFQNLIRDINYEEFKYSMVLDKMCEQAPENRFESFQELDIVLSNKVLNITEFTEAEKQVYNDFLSSLENSLVYYIYSFIPQRNISNILNELETILENHSLEDFIQNNNNLISIFIKNAYRYSSNNISIEVVRQFYELLVTSSIKKQEIIVNNVINRLSAIKVDEIDDSDLPF